MINREMRNVQLLTYSTVVDEYGQKRQSNPSITNIQMVCKLYHQSNTNDMLYVDVDMIGITKCSTITDANEIRIDSNDYLVKYVIPSGKYHQILMKKKS